MIILKLIKIVDIITTFGDVIGIVGDSAAAQGARAAHLALRGGGAEDLCL